MLPLSTEKPVQRLIWNYAETVRPRHVRRARKPKPATSTLTEPRPRGSAGRKKTSACKRFTKSFENQIEARLFAAEELVVFDLDDWERICHLLLPDRHASPDTGIVRINRATWEELCDRLLVAERAAEVADEERRRERGDIFVWPPKKAGPPRWVEFEFAEYAKLLQIVLPERFGKVPLPARTSCNVPGTAAKIREMSVREKAGEALFRKDDARELHDRLGLRVEGVDNHRKHAATVRGEDGAVRLVEAEVFGVGWVEDGERLQAAASVERLSLDGCIDEADDGGDDDGYINPATCQSAEARESGCRRVKESVG